MTQHVIIVATRNPHKTKEIREILGAKFVIHDLSEHPDLPEIEETGKTFAENAILKATAVSRQIPGIVLADDSGLEVDALGGAPGVYSARYSGTGDDSQNVEKLLCELDRVDPKQQRRGAHFQCVIAVAHSGKVLKTFVGSVEGSIAEQPRGSGGFGYDPVFIPNGYSQTFSELPAVEKNQLSHRGRALAAAVPFLRAPTSTVAS